MAAPGFRSVARRAIGSGVQVGVYAADNAADGPVVPYDSFSLNAQSDEFAGTALEKCRFSQIVREAAAGYRVANGVLEIDTGAGEIDGTAPNLIGQPVPAGTWEAETKLDLTTTLRASRPACCSTRSRRTGSRSCSFARARPRPRSSSSASRTAPTRLDAPFNVGVATTVTSVYLRMRANGAHGDRAVLHQRHRPGPRSARRATSPIWAPATSARSRCAAGAATAVTAKFDYLRVRTAALFTTVGITSSGQRHQPDQRQPAVLAAGGGDAAVGHGRPRRPTTPPTTCRCGCPTRPARSRTSPTSAARR